MSFTVVNASTQFGFLPYRDQDVSLEKLISIMDAYGVAASLSCSLKGVAYDFAEGNDETLIASKANPRIFPVMTVDPRRYLGVVEEIEKRKKQGFVALRVFPEQQGWRINTVMMKPIIRELERLRMPLMLTCSGNGTVTDVLSAIGDAEIPVILCTVGYGNLGEVLVAMMENPNLYADTQINDTPDSLRVAVDAVGAERFVFGSASPSASMRTSLNLIAESSLTDEQKAKIFSGNICRILGIQAPAGIDLSLGKPFEGMPIIDIHTHYGKWPFPMKDWGIQFSLGLMRERGISKAIMSSASAIVYDFVEGNREMAAAIEGHPELLGYVTVNPNYFDASCRELEEYYKKPNFVGAKIHPAYCRRAINAPQTRALVRKVADYGRPLLIHTYGQGTPSQILDLVRDCPDLPIIMGHGGADAWREAADVVKQCENVYMEFCSSVLETDKVRRSIEIVGGADKILFGTDLDLIHPGMIAGCYEEAGLSHDEKEKILHQNASRLFGIG
jgi:predicted TIM-barrel fold metal-dependent hydrolase